MKIALANSLAVTRSQGVETIDPATLANLVLYMSGADGSKVLDSGGSPANQGDRIETWNDKSATGASFVSFDTTDATRPYYDKEKKALVFDDNGVDKELDWTGNLDLTGDYSFWIIMALGADDFTPFFRNDTDSETLVSITNGQKPSIPAVSPSFQTDYIVDVGDYVCAGFNYDNSETTVRGFANGVFTNTVTGLTNDIITSVGVLWKFLHSIEGHSSYIKCLVISDVVESDETMIGVSQWLMQEMGLGSVIDNVHELNFDDHENSMYVPMVF